jgi:lipopolysaccharide export system ATP-binding protein
MAKNAPPLHLLSISSLSKRRKKRHVAKDVNLRITSGEVVGLLGPNGAGKTTVFHMIAGLLKPDAGSVLLDRDDLSMKTHFHRSRYGLVYLAQEPSIFRNLTVEENLKAVLYSRRIDRTSKENWLKFALDKFNLRHIRNSRADKLSGGERRKVEILRLLATSPMFMLLDEPFAGVDPISVTELQDLIRMLSEAGVGVMVSDHNVRECLSICHRTYILRDGQVVKEATPREIALDDDVRQFYLGREFTL